MAAMVAYRDAPPPSHSAHAHPVVDAGYTPTVSAERILAMARARAEADGPVLSAARDIAAAYDADLHFPVPSGWKGGAVANLIRQGIDGVGMRVADPPETVLVTPHRNGERAEGRAEEQRRAFLGLLEAAEHDLVKRSRARHLVGYGRSPVLVSPDFESHTVAWEALSPLQVLPGEVRKMAARDGIIVSSCTWGWLCDRYPDAAALMWKGPGGAEAMAEHTLVRLLRWQSATECVLVCAGRADQAYPRVEDVRADGGQAAVVVEAYPNPAGTSGLFVPKAITATDSGRTVFEQLVGMYVQRAELNALSVEAVRRGVFQDEWVVARPNEVPEVDATPDPATGQIGVVRGADLVGRPVDPQFMQNQAMDRMEYAERATAGVPSEFGGQAGGNVRTGRRGSQVMASAVDFPVAEAQNLLARSLAKELRAAALIHRAWFPSEQVSWHVQWKGARGRVSYQPKVMWATVPSVRVSHVAPGTDLSDLVVIGGQLVGIGAMSRRSLMKMTPLVEDVEAEESMILEQGLLDAWWSSVQAMAANPEGPLQPVDFARLARLITESGLSPYEAMEQVQREAQERQAAQVPAGDPALQPGLSMPGQGAEAGGGVPAIADPTQSMPSMQNMNALLAGLTGPQFLGGIPK